MKQILNDLIRHQHLSKDDAKSAMLSIGKGDVNPAQMAAFISVYMMRCITVAELQGFREALLEMCLNTDLSEYNPIDIVGTGGDGKDTFNISTLSCFVVAGAGIKVSKHGNYAVSSNCGSSNVLESLGYTFTNKKDILRKQLEEANFCMLHAPLFHPALKNVAPVRKELGMKTIFNMLGPLVNPSFPTHHMLGTFSMDLARLYSYIHQTLNNSYSIVYALDGYDEISLTGPFKVFSNQMERVIEPDDLSLHTWKPEELYGGKTVEDSAAIFMNVLKNTCTKAQREVVLANAGLAIALAKPEISLSDAIATARESLESGKALQTLELLLKNNA